MKLLSTILLSCLLAGCAHKQTATHSPPVPPLPPGWEDGGRGIRAAALPIPTGYTMAWDTVPVNAASFGFRVRAVNGALSTNWNLGNVRSFTPPLAPGTWTVTVSEILSNGTVWRTSNPLTLPVAAPANTNWNYHLTHAPVLAGPWTNYVTISNVPLGFWRGELKP